MVRLALRTGLRWKLSAVIALVGALVAIALSLVVHNAARDSMLDNSRDVQIERLTFTQKIFVSTNRLQFGAKIDDPALPEALRDEVAKNKRATYLQDTGQTAPDVWAASPLSNGRVLSVHDRFPDRFAVLDDLDQALVIGSTAVVVGGCALGVLVGGRLSKRLRKAAAAAGKLADGDTAVRIRDEVGSGRVRDETDDLAFAVDAMSDALQERIEAERRVTADIAHELRTPVTGLLTAAELLPPGRPSELVRDRAQALRTLVEDVLEVARLDGDAERAELQSRARRVRHPAGARPRPGASHRCRTGREVTTDLRRLERFWATYRQRRPARQAADRGHRRGPGPAGPRPRHGLPRGAAARGPQPLPDRAAATGRAGATAWG